MYGPRTELAGSFYVQQKMSKCYAHSFFHIIENAWKILSDRGKASMTLDVSFKRQIVIPINLSLLELTSKVLESFFHSLKILYAIPIAHYIPFFARNVQPLILQRQQDTLPTAKKWKGEVKSESKIYHTYQHFNKNNKSLITKKVTCYVNYTQVQEHAVYLI